MRRGDCGSEVKAAALALVPEILGTAKNVQALLSGAKYGVDGGAKLPRPI
jgi:hypothetical protein